MTAPDKPLIVQSDMTVLLETGAASAPAARAELARFAELEKAPEHFHTYRITPLSLWNAAVAGVTVDQVLDALTSLAKYDVADVVVSERSEEHTSELQSH